MSFPIKLDVDNALEIKQGDTFSQLYRISVSIDGVKTPVDFEAEGWTNWTAKLEEFKTGTETFFEVGVDVGEITISLTAAQTAAIQDPARFEIKAERGSETLLISGTAQANYENIVLAKNPTIYLKFNELNGATVANDNSGYGRNFNIANGVFTNTERIFGNSANTAWLANGFIRPLNNTLDQTEIMPETGFTVSFATKQSTGIAFSAYPEGNTSGMYIWTNEDGTVGFGTLKDGSYSNVNSTSAINDGELHHIALVWNGSSRLVYVDGILESSDIPTQTYTATVGTVNFDFVKYADVGDGYIDGQVISHFAIFPSVLTGTEILAQNNAMRGIINNNNEVRTWLQGPAQFCKEL